MDARMVMPPLIRGRVRVGHAGLPPGPWRPNTVMREWGAIVGPLLATADRTRRVSMMYIEFANVGSPGDPVAPPALDRDSGGRSYYDGLVLDPSRDYLRVPMRTHSIHSSDEELYPEGNVVTFYARTAGLAGTHGKPFSDADNSKVYGAALVAARSQADPSQDLVLSRFYFPTGEQMVKLPTNQIGVEWELELQ